MIQVFKAFDIEHHSTFFTAVSIIDRYFIKKAEEKISLGPECLHLIGMVAVLLAAKVEERKAITLKRLVRRAGGSKYSQEEVVAMEKSILFALGFRLHSPNSLYHEAMLAFKTKTSEAPTKWSPALLKEAEDHLAFLCYLASYSIRF